MGQAARVVEADESAIIDQDVVNENIDGSKLPSRIRLMAWGFVTGLVLSFALGLVRVIAI